MEKTVCHAKTAQRMACVKAMGQEKEMDIAIAIEDTQEKIVMNVPTDFMSPSKMKQSFFAHNVILPVKIHVKDQALVIAKNVKKDGFKETVKDVMM